MKEARLKRLHIMWLHLYKILEDANKSIVTANHWLLGDGQRL